MGFFIGFGIGIVGFVISIFVVFAIKMRFKIDDLKIENNLLRIANEGLNIENRKLANMNDFRKRFYSPKYFQSNIPDGTVEAVRYAMKKAHPDNGGNAKDFMKFKKLYEELTK